MKSRTWYLLGGVSVCSLHVLCDPDTGVLTHLIVLTFPSLLALQADVAPTTMDSEGTNADVSDATATKKVGTHGTRESRRETWRKARGWKPKVGSKNGGRTKRRR